ncbi:hypothetical protein IWQ60_004412 [Tieghemiomyces parasiticus]|uniref:Uncharacterized protein n=1 Tax=Tieghemiomyces parasiticus TaxID=78921 RepID=A0A9W8A8E6_9FUNG|nr:hypothetical protein IWQ60_004412 [Tieghemiomyces parasiticus]
MESHRKPPFSILDASVCSSRHPNLTPPLDAFLSQSNANLSDISRRTSLAHPTGGPLLSESAPQYYPPATGGPTALDPEYDGSDSFDSHWTSLVSLAHPNLPPPDRESVDELLGRKGGEPNVLATGGDRVERSEFQFQFPPSGRSAVVNDRGTLAYAEAYSAIATSATAAVSLTTSSRAGSVRASSSSSTSAPSRRPRSARANTTATSTVSAASRRSSTADSTAHISKSPRSQSTAQDHRNRPLSSSLARLDLDSANMMQTRVRDPPERATVSRPDIPSHHPPPPRDPSPNLVGGEAHPTTADLQHQVLQLQLELAQVRERHAQEALQRERQLAVVIDRYYRHPATHEASTSLSDAALRDTLQQVVGAYEARLADLHATGRRPEAQHFPTRGSSSDGQYSSRNHHQLPSAASSHTDGGCVSTTATQPFAVADKAPPSAMAEEALVAALRRENELLKLRLHAFNHPGTRRDDVVAMSPAESTAAAIPPNKTQLTRAFIHHDKLHWKYQLWKVDDLVDSDCRYLIKEFMLLFKVNDPRHLMTWLYLRRARHQERHTAASLPPGTTAQHPRH